jgi:hypothetical protein
MTEIIEKNKIKIFIKMIITQGFDTVTLRCVVIKIRPISMFLSYK